ncbi:MAG: NrdR family transcriptional regulator [Alphaproteobacteria bacterium]|nr:NrdR family transcriptional regulator [Alphaproteobacteria bacterium]
MRCPFCNHPDTGVKDSRTTEDNATIRRRRFCIECGSRFTTFERVQLRDLMVLKKSGVRVPFDRDKLARSIESALHKRTIDPERTERVISSIVRQLETSGETEIPTTHIGEMAMEALHNLDAVAYVRFASIYKEFSDVKDFVAFIKNNSL